MPSLIEYGFLNESSLRNLLQSYSPKSKKIILVDDNTNEFCLSYLIGEFDELSEAEIILLPVGEETKSLELAYNVWQTLTEYEVSRKDLIINLGGGVITDFGGFIASTYKRGIDFIHIPTSLLGMVDAAIGGKTGLNLGPYKNQIGTFSQPKAVYIDHSFLETLTMEDLNSGRAEMIKHGLISSYSLFEKAISLDLENISLEEVKEFSEVKRKVIKNDIHETGERKKLNFGHTVGHAIEGAFIGELSHGHCVAIGMMVESYLSVLHLGFPKDQYESIEKSIKSLYSTPIMDNQQKALLINLISNDKKNFNGEVKCVLLKKIGSAVIDVTIDAEEIKYVIEKLLA